MGQIIDLSKRFTEQTELVTEMGKYEETVILEDGRILLFTFIENSEKIYKQLLTQISCLRLNVYAKDVRTRQNFVYIIHDDREYHALVILNKDKHVRDIGWSHGQYQPQVFVGIQQWLNKYSLSLPQSFLAS